MECEGRKRSSGLGSGGRFIEGSIETEDPLLSVDVRSFVSKEEQALAVPRLVAGAVYEFSISAKFLDGSFGPSSTAWLDTTTLTTGRGRYPLDGQMRYIAVSILKGYCL